MNKIINLLNECGNALNQLQHDNAAKLISRIDQVLSKSKVPLDIIFYRLKLGAELAKRTGDIKDALEKINEYLPTFEVNPKLQFHLLIIAGKLEMTTNRLNVSTKYVTEALGLAETIGEKSLIAEAYSTIGRMFSPKYTGLAFYFYHKAEILLKGDGETATLEALKMERALLSLIFFLNNRRKENERFQNEANRIIEGLNTAEFNDHQKRQYRYIRAFIKADEGKLEKLMVEMRGCNALPDACRYGEVCLMICIEKGLFEKASEILKSHKDDLIRYHGDSADLHKHIENLDKIIKQRIRSQFIPFKIIKEKEEATTILDLLDKYAIADEYWALEEGWVRHLFPSYNQEGFFDAIRMPDDSVRLYPCGIAFNIYYRGQSKYHDPSYPTLYRKGITEAERFVERIKYEELRHCVDSYPLSDIFRDSIYYTAPDKSVLHIPLSLDHLALAQHYGIKTELMDVTADKFVAAFFATTEVNENGEYMPIVDNRNEKGVFYRCQDPGLFKLGSTMSKLRAVGLQPFSRPGEQAGLVYEMTKDENFNNLVISKEFFSHDKEASEFIFNYTNRSKKLFPKSPLEAHASAIRCSNVFSNYAYNEAKRNFYNDAADETLMSYLSDQGITISEEANFDFTQEEKEQCIKDWDEGGEKQLLSKIIIRPVYNGNDIPIYGPNTRFDT